MTISRMLKNAKIRWLTRHPSGLLRVEVFQCTTSSRLRTCCLRAAQCCRTATVRKSVPQRLFQQPATGCRCIPGWALTLAGFLLTGCGRAPSFDVLGSFFPAWLACLALGIVLTAAARWLLLRLHIVIALPVLTYPSLTALFSFALWLLLFR